MSEDVVNHYQQPMLFSRIRDALKAQGKDMDKIQVEDLWPVDQFHIGGAGSTLKLLTQVDLSTDDKVLDVGCGIGGPCRLIASTFQCLVQGIDLTPKYIETAQRLSQLVGLQDLTTFQTADALDLPFTDDSFDAVWTQHAQMNISDKARFYDQMVRVLKPGGSLVYHDIFSAGGMVQYPTPWSEDGSISYLFTHDELKDMLQAKGLSLELHQEETDFAIKFFEELLESFLAKGSRPPLGLHLVMGGDAPIKIRNLLQNLTTGSLEVHQAVYKR